MNSLKTSLMTKSIFAVVVAASGIAASGIAASATGLNSTPNDGMLCRTGYTGTFDGTRLTCAKGVAAIVVGLKCANLTFPDFVMRAGGPGPKGDHDLCTRRKNSPGAVVITTNGALNGLTESTTGSNGDYQYATVDTVELSIQTNLKDQAEATALGLSVDQVETINSVSMVVRNGGTGGLDRVDTVPMHFTFAIPGFGGVIINPGPFVPRPLP